jgi:CP family cyanate transporter-like MFS transporter
MFVLVLAGIVALTWTGWLITRERYVDDEVKKFVPAWSSEQECDDVLEVAGTEPPVATHVRTGGGSPRG